MNWSIEKRADLTIKLSLIFLLVGMLLSLKLWLSNRYFPLVPIFEFIPTLPSPFDAILLFTFVLSIILQLLTPTVKISKQLFWASAFLLLITDINRMQPWVYLYLLVLVIREIFKMQIEQLKWIKLLLASVYFYSGWHKLNPNYFYTVIDWFIQPFCSEKTTVCNILFYIGSTIPLFEMACGLAFLSGKLVKQAIGAVALIHLYILLLLSPIGQNYNTVIWPWNIFMLLATVIVFYNSENENLLIYIKNILRNEKHLKKLSVAFVVVTPFLNSFNLWPSYLSWNLYSGNTENAKLYLGDKVHTYFSPAFDEIIKNCYDAPYTINPKKWALKELNVPPFPEKPVWHACHKFMLEFTGNPNEVVLNIQPKSSLFIKKETLTY